MKNKDLKLNILRMTSVFFIGAAFTTLLPMPLSDKTAIIGYGAICPFAPLSTALLFYIGLIIHRYLESKKMEVTVGKYNTNRR